MSLCAACLRARLIESRRGPVYVLCTLSETDPAYDKYPAQPVIECAGFEPSDPESRRTT